MSEITTLQPQLLWKWFDQICAIPHPSHHEDALATFIVNWAKEKQFFAERDEAGNVLIRKPATAGMENSQPVVLQAHLDMVPQANEGNPHNFAQDPIRPYIDGDWVKAQGTTLGADNGIGLASTLAVLESTDIAHPPLEVLLTMTEETGMDGAVHLQVVDVQYRYFLIPLKSRLSRYRYLRQVSYLVLLPNPHQYKGELGLE